MIKTMLIFFITNLMLQIFYYIIALYLQNNVFDSLYIINIIEKKI